MSDTGNLIIMEEKIKAPDPWPDEIKEFPRGHDDSSSREWRILSDEIPKFESTKSEFIVKEASARYTLIHWICGITALVFGFGVVSVVLDSGPDKVKLFLEVFDKLLPVLMVLLGAMLGYFFGAKRGEK